MAGGPGIENGVDAPIEIVEHVGGGGGAGVSKLVSAGCGQGNTGAADQFEGNRMSRHAHPYQAAASRHDVRNGTASGQQQSERTGPKGGHQFERRGRDFRNQVRKHGLTALASGNVDDHRVPGGALFSREDSFHGCRVKDIGAQPIHRLCGEGHQSTGAQNLSRLAEIFPRLRRFKVQGIYGQSQSLHHPIFASAPGPRHLPYTHCNRCLSKPRSNSASTTLRG
jgi:hypothetical protein